jgi:hypothetical protein
LPAVLKNLPVRTCFNRVESIDCDRHVITIEGGQAVPYWRLVVASGAVPSVPPVPGLAENAITIGQSPMPKRSKTAFANRWAGCRVGSTGCPKRFRSPSAWGNGRRDGRHAVALPSALPRWAGSTASTFTWSRTRQHLGAPAREQRLSHPPVVSAGVKVVAGSMVQRGLPRGHLADGVDVPAAVLLVGQAHTPSHAKAWGFG